MLPAVLFNTFILSKMYSELRVLNTESSLVWISYLINLFLDLFLNICKFFQIFIMLPLYEMFYECHLVNAWEFVFYVCNMLSIRFDVFGFFYMHLNVLYNVFNVFVCLKCIKFVIIAHQVLYTSFLNQCFIFYLLYLLH